MKSDDPISPLTIIAIFAGIIEASALASLPFLSEKSQSIYTWFLVAFPFFLTVLFFLTLNFNYASLYKPIQAEPQAGRPRSTRATAWGQQRVEGGPSTSANESPNVVTIALSGPETRKTIEQHVLRIVTQPSEHMHSWVLYNLDCRTCVNLSVRPLEENEGPCPASPP
ncbi:hypothetical protein ACQKPE_02275 [Pseudomonas sp. NPDC089554]|uniref:hypothetical protein n=1 Tax=Pseudomonas sp. NPDC089554 TaxID=3390653 RepID=UPI003D06DED1